MKKKFLNRNWNQKETKMWEQMSTYKTSDWLKCHPVFFVSQELDFSVGSKKPQKEKIGNSSLTRKSDAHT